jgi:HD-GYP domain-containing protein (c-di-GMP phosphodiesterase class II)
LSAGSLSRIARLRETFVTVARRPTMLGFLPVATAGLSATAVLNCDLFIRWPGRRVTELYRGRNYTLGESDLAHLRAEGVEKLYIRLADADAYRDYLCEHVLHREELPVAVRLGALKEVTRVAFQDALASRGTDRLIETAGSFGRELTSLVAEKPSAFGEVFKMLEHDYYTFTHVCNVAVYCSLLAKLLGMTGEHELSELAAAALLHDIGKRHIPLAVLNKAERLTEEEWDLIREHPASGFRELAQRGDLSWAQLMVVYQHHERLDGQGYPVGTCSDGIHPWAKICAVADVFDALSCHRPYRLPMPLPAVCEYLSEHAGTAFDPEIARCWVDHASIDQHD